MAKSYVGKTVNGVPFDQTGNVDIVTDIGGVPMLIVNSDYTGDIELGTVSKPFKNTQNALDAYVGNGASNKAPENIGTTIVVQKDVNTFVGSLTYAGLNIQIESGATLVSNPSSGTFLLDLDSEATLPTNPNYSMLPFGNAESCDISITIKTGGAIQLQKEGFKNRGNTLNTGSSLGKIIRISADSSGLYKIAEASVVSPSTEQIFSLNEDNQTGFYNDSAGACILINSTTVQSFNSQIAYVGLGTTLRIAESTFQFGSGATPFNINTVPFQINGGNVIFNDSSINNPLLLVNLISLKTQTSTGAVFNSTNSKIGDSCDYIFANLDTGTTTSNQLILDKINSNSAQVETFIKNFMSSNIWYVNLTGCNVITWAVDESKIALTPSSLNTLGGQVVETLLQYATKAIAVSAGLFTGCAFTQVTDVSAVDLVAGIEYKITTEGVPSLGTLNTYFTATGSETGTGIGTLYQRETII